MIYEGRRIVDMKHVFNQIKKSQHLGTFDCTFMNVDLINEVRKGFETTWTFKCTMCQSITVITSESKELNYVPINQAIVNGTIAIGIGHTQLAELSASIDVPCMSSKTYSKFNNSLCEVITSTAWDAMKLAGMEEKRLALEANDIDIDGTPMCPVIADGQWSKRSYRTKYDALSGAV